MTHIHVETLFCTSRCYRKAAQTDPDVSPDADGGIVCTTLPNDGRERLQSWLDIGFCPGKKKRC